MFLGNLSTANEHEARKKKSGKKKSKDDVVEIEGSEFPHLRRLKPGERPIIYSAEKAGDIPRDVLMGFLVTMVEMMLDEGNINELINLSVSTKKGLQDVAVDFQRDVMEYNFQMERNYGCRYLATIPDKFPKDAEIIAATQKFMFTALKSYLKALNQRHRRYKNGSLTPPNPNAPLSRISIMEFLEGCNATMAMPETKKELRAIAVTTGEMPGQRIIEMQRALLPVIGYDADFGVSCLNKMTSDFPNDRELYQKFQLYAAAAEFAGIEATFTEEQRAGYYKQMPPMMHHFPHMFFLQQRQQQQMAQHNQQRAYREQMEARMAMDRGGAGSAAAGAVAPSSSAGGEVGGRMDAESLKASGMLSMLMSPEGREKLQGLAAKVQDSKTRLEPVVFEWGLDKKKAFFDGFKDHHLMDVLGKGGADPTAKMMALTSMSGSDIDELMKLLIVISQEDSGELLASLREQVTQENESAAPGANSALAHIIKTMGSLANLNRVGPASAPHGAPGHVHGPDCQHGHGHGGHGHGHGDAGHVHGPDCQHGHGHGGHGHGHGGGYSMGVPPALPSQVSSGKAVEMDR